MKEKYVHRVGNNPRSSLIFFFLILTGRESILSSKYWRWYVCWKSFSCTMNGMIDRDWNFICFPLSLWALSHFKTRSPTLNYFFLVDFLSNHLLIWFWWSEFFSFAFNLSSCSLWRVSILCLNNRHGLPWDSSESWRAGK